MIIRKIVKIDSEKCDGCGLCVTACHEGAIGLVEGKAVLLRDDYCDGLGDCLPACPREAISFEMREALPFDEAAVLANQERAKQEAASSCTACPGSATKTLEGSARDGAAPAAAPISQLRQWPVQIKLLPVKAPFFDGAHLLVAADCSAFACGDFHQRFMRNKVTLIGCPKLDGVDYSEKLREIIAQNDIRSLTVVRMEVPCCSGLEAAATKALQGSGKFIPWQVVTLRSDGSVID